MQRAKTKRAKDGAPAKRAKPERRAKRTRRPSEPHACFRCRMSFQRAPAEELRRCPRCRKRLYAMGPGFKPPHRGDREQWLRGQSLYALGFRFLRRRGVRPKLPRWFFDVLGFVAENPTHPLRVAAVDETAIPDDLRPISEPRVPKRRKRRRPASRAG